ncbi:MAG TPA: glycerophosphodiester phosphodiesterase [Acidimicrobiia bacterium]|nr:glycerophosphodiester phosphodiesterase [Acidimicrobiia bacterium]
MIGPWSQTASPLGIAHRGSRLLWPENTLVAFAGAKDSGLSWFETDVRVTRDGELVCFHDGRLERTTDGRGFLATTTWAEVSALDAGYHHRHESGYTFRGRGVSVPRFTDVLAAHPEAGLVVDLKAEGTEAPLARHLAEAGREDRVIVGSFSESRLARFRHLTEGRVATSAGPGAIIRAILSQGRGSFGRLLEGPARVFQVPVTWYGVPVVTPSFVRRVHAAGKQVQVWTVNHPEEMKRLVDLGVDGIITDRPDLLAPLLAP